MEADFYINVFTDEERLKKLEEVGLSEHVEEINGKKGIRVAMSAKEQKKLLKSFPDLKFDASKACVLPKETEEMLFNMIVDMKSFDIMKVFIMKAYNPLAGKELRHKVH